MMCLGIAFFELSYLELYRFVSFAKFGKISGVICLITFQPHCLLPFWSSDETHAQIFCYDPTGF